MSTSIEKTTPENRIHAMGNATKAEIEMYNKIDSNDYIKKMLVIARAHKCLNNLAGLTVDNLVSEFEERVKLVHIILGYNIPHEDAICKLFEEFKLQFAQEKHELVQDFIASDWHEFKYLKIRKYLNT
jgi:hypothetical protein